MVLLPFLVNRPRKVFVDELLVLFGYPSGSAAALLDGELPLRYCSGRIASRVPTWGLPASGSVRSLVAEFADVEEVSRNSLVARARFPVLVGGAGVLGGRRILGSVKRVRPGVWKRLRVEGSGYRHFVAKVPRLRHGDEDHGPQDRVGVG